MKVYKLVEMMARFRHRLKYKDQPVNFLTLTDNRETCLVCLPANLDHMLKAATVLPQIAAIFPNRLVKVMVTSNIDHRSHEYIKKFTIEKPYSYDITTFNLPKKNFMEKLTKKGISICIDLDFEHNFFNSSVSVHTKAPLRIGCRKGMGLPYYNLEIDVGDRNELTAESYTNFIKVLYNFKDKGETVAPIEA